MKGNSAGSNAGPRRGWTIVGPVDRAMDVHLQLLADAATEALSRLDDCAKVQSSMGEAARATSQAKPA